MTSDEAVAVLREMIREPDWQFHMEHQDEAGAALDFLVAEVEAQWRVAQECRDNFARLFDERSKLLVEILGLTAARDEATKQRDFLNNTTAIWHARAESLETILREVLDEHGIPFDFALRARITALDSAALSSQRQSRPSTRYCVCHHSEKVHDEDGCHGENVTDMVEQSSGPCSCTGFVAMRRESV